MPKETSNQIPLPPLPTKVELFMPIEFWSEVLMTLDKKIQAVAQIYGFGKVSLTVSITNGGITEVSFDDNIRIRGLVEKAKLHNANTQDTSKKTVKAE